MNKKEKVMLSGGIVLGLTAKKMGRRRSRRVGVVQTRVRFFFVSDKVFTVLVYFISNDDGVSSFFLSFGGGRGWW